MVNSTWIPSSYTTRWRAARRQSLPSPSAQAAHSPPMPTYNSSCTNCTRSRVRCSGGNPCDRCEKSLLDPLLCVYELSRRHGKRRAREFEAHSLGSSSTSTDQQPEAAILPWQGGPTSTPLSVDSLLGIYSSEFDQLAPFSLSQKYPRLDDCSSSLISSVVNVDTLNIDEPLVATENFNGFLNGLGAMVPMRLSRSSPLLSAKFDESDEIAGYRLADSSSNSCDCPRLTQDLLSRLTLASVEPGKVGLDEILLSFHQVSRHAVNYLNCAHCDSGYPRLVNLAMLHQSQVALLYNMTKSPAVYFGSSHGPEAARFTLGVYQLPEADDLYQKRLALLAVGRKVESLVTNFESVINAREDLEIASNLGGTDLAKINRKWLLEVSRNLKSQLESILAIFEQADWSPGPSTYSN
ncbi:hypothetical protein F5Y09DRAFT_248758 [Xylaria sp. FL1042]|nr:hypothetical protein F5Y09DRAFT_248758 [Xylaria sp. FL1042]